GYLESQIDGKFLVGNAMTLADIAIVSNFIVYQYIGYKLDSAAYPKLCQYVRGIAGQDAYRKALEDEKPVVANIGLDRSCLDYAKEKVRRVGKAKRAHLPALDAEGGHGARAPLPTLQLRNLRPYPRLQQSQPLAEAERVERHAQILRILLEVGPAIGVHGND